MKRIIMFCTGLLLCQMMAVASVLTSDTLVVRIKGMRCEECGHKVSNVLKKEKGVGTLQFDFEKRTIAIEYDEQQVSADTLKARLAATGRYKASAYDKNEVIRRGMGLHVEDMHCQNCADRIMQRLSQLEGVDSIAPHVDKQYVFIRYDANKTTKAVIREILQGMGFTPVNYYTSKNISYAYFVLHDEQVNDEAVETALSLDGVDDANVCKRQKSLAITYVNTETDEAKLLQALKDNGINAVVPPAHECKEK